MDGWRNGERGVGGGKERGVEEGDIYPKEGGVGKEGRAVWKGREGWRNGKRGRRWEQEGGNGRDREERGRKEGREAGIKIAWREVAWVWLGICLAEGDTESQFHDNSHILRRLIAATFAAPGQANAIANSITEGTPVSPTFYLTDFMN